MTPSLDTLRRLMAEAGERDIGGFAWRHGADGQEQKVFDTKKGHIATFFHEEEARLYAHTRNALPKLLAVVEASEKLLELRTGKRPVEGYIRDNDASRARIEALAAALAALSTGDEK